MPSPWLAALDALVGYCVKLHILQGILVPSLHYRCALSGMHSPNGTAQRARTAVQSICDRYLRHICRVKYATSSAMLLRELWLSLLQGFWWRQTLEFCIKLAAIPVGSHFHTILLDHVDDAFSVGEWRQELFWLHSYLFAIYWAAHAL